MGKLQDDIFNEKPIYAGLVEMEKIFGNIDQKKTQFDSASKTKGKDEDKNFKNTSDTPAVEAF